MSKKEISGLHPQNLHQGRYDLETLMRRVPALELFVFKNEFGNLTLDFSNPEAVKSLNGALLKHYYGLDFWDIPEGFLCPPIPGRADYIHYLADLLSASNSGKLPAGEKIKVLDIGTGANLIYPILGNSVYSWSFVCSELNPIALESAEQIISKNSWLKNRVEVRQQMNSDQIFSGIIQKEEFFDLTLCNPPFHDSPESAQAGSKRKVENLSGKVVAKAKLNFGGQASELWTEGGELEFIRKMVVESQRFKHQVFWFSTLVSKSENLRAIYDQLKKSGVYSYRTVEMAQGNKKSRFVAWTYLNEKQQKGWKAFRWK
jgi:23S rRNA (adenine1618-N6)-methyltransferase